MSSLYEGKGISKQSSGNFIVGSNISSNQTNNFKLSRFTSTGSLDTSFGTSGYTIAQAGILTDIAVQSTDSIIAVGYVIINGVSNYKIVKFNSSGAIDTTFATSGILTGVIGNGLSLNSVSINTDDSIISSGSVNIYGSPNYIILKITTGGILDSSFGASGVVTGLNNGFSAICNSVYIQSDGSILISGISNNMILVLKFSSTGVSDNTFNLGNSINGIAYNTITLGDGTILTVGESGTTGFIAKYNSDGSVVTGFGASGVVSTMFGSKNDIIFSILNQSDNSVVISGKSDDRAFIARFTSAGVLDTTYNSIGVGYYITGNISSWNDSLIISGNKIVTVGVADDNYTIAIYANTGILDSSFNNGIVVSVPVKSGLDNIQAYDTTTQNVAIANTFQDITFNTNLDVGTWTHSTASSTQNFICPTTGRYSICYSFSCSKNVTNMTAVVSFRVVQNGTEISASDMVQTLTTSDGTNTVNVSKQIMIPIISSDIIKFQFTDTLGICRIIASTGSSSVKSSASISINRIS
jgi:uncharacterized delta-60 repeat protein